VAEVPSLFPDPVIVEAVPEPLPRAYAVGGARVADGIHGLMALIDPAFDPRREIVLPEGRPVVAPEGFHGEARVVRESADRVRLDVELSADGYVVLVDGHDPGWRVRVDGRPAPLLRANVAFRAVAVPAGRHVVDMVYRPTAALVGLVEDVRERAPQLLQRAGIAITGNRGLLQRIEAAHVVEPHYVVGVAVREQDRIHAIEVVREGLGAEVRGRVDEHPDATAHLEQD
jgi:hypothetical protein